MGCILVVDDEPAIGEVVADLLDDLGYDARRAVNGVEALRLMLEAPVDLLISDVMMPRMDGITLCQAVQQHPELSAIPVVLMSAASHLPPPTVCQPAAFLAKPLDFGHLEQTVARLVRPAQS